MSRKYIIRLSSFRKKENSPFFSFARDGGSGNDSATSPLPFILTAPPRYIMRVSLPVMSAIFKIFSSVSGVVSLRYSCRIARSTPAASAEELPSPAPTGMTEYTVIFAPPVWNVSANNFAALYALVSFAGTDGISYSLPSNSIEISPSRVFTASIWLPRSISTASESSV